MAKLEKKNISQPDGSNQMDHIKVESFMIGDMKINKHTAEKGWQWTKYLKPIVGTDTCQMQHHIQVLSGTLLVKTDDGQELELVAGDFCHIPPGHDAWTVGDIPVVWLEFLR